MQILQLFFLALVFILGSAVNPSQLMENPCQPFGVRLALGGNYHDSRSSEILSVWFNTPEKCQRSFVLLQKSPLQVKKIYCDFWETGLENYKTFIHRCSISDLEKGNDFQYMVFGWTGNSSDSWVPFRIEKVNSHIPQGGNNFKMVVLADWSYLDKKRDQYTPLDNSFNKILQSNTIIDGLFIDGDVAYDLDYNDGKNYENFLIMLSQVSCSWPIIINTGNHEHYSKYDFKILNDSFETYGMTQNLTSTVNLGAFGLVMYDPYHILYDDEHPNALLAKVKSQILTFKANFPSKPLVVASHYPILCSGPSKTCVSIEETMRDFYTFFKDSRVALYIGAHYHIYERTYPYIGKGKTIQLDPPYDINRETNYLLSIMEGIAGNDKNIIETMDKIQPVTAALSYNITGYGMLTFEGASYTYEHFTNKDSETPVDKMTVNFDYRHMLRQE